MVPFILTISTTVPGPIQQRVESPGSITVEKAHSTPIPPKNSAILTSTTLIIFLADFNQIQTNHWLSSPGELPCDETSTLRSFIKRKSPFHILQPVGDTVQFWKQRFPRDSVFEERHTYPASRGALAPHPPESSRLA